MNQLSGRRTCPIDARASNAEQFPSQKRRLQRLSRFRFQSALSEKEPERRISVKRLVNGLLGIPELPHKSMNVNNGLWFPWKFFTGKAACLQDSSPLPAVDLFRLLHENLKSL
jgi:hypothetical protein